MAKVVLITGASHGIGKATARCFAQRGDRLVLAARTPEPLKQAAIDLEQELDAEVLALPTDVTEPEQVESLVDQALKRFDHIDILINNAGICASGPFADTTLDHWQQLLQVNFWGYLHTIRALLPHLLQRGQGQIVNVGSVGGKMPLPEMTAYCASKYAVSGLTEALRLELQPKGIEVIGVHPGIVRSDFLERAIFVGPEQSEEPVSKSQMQVALDSWLVSQPEEVATAILEACLEHKTEVVVGAAQWMTGAYALLPEPIRFLMQNTTR